MSSLRVLTSAEMREVDRRAVHEVGIPLLCLMENAGRAVADALEEALQDASSLSVAVVCGRGNNGGDGLVAARHLASRGHLVQAVLLGRVDELKNDAVRGHARALRGMGVPLVEAVTRESLAEALVELEADAVIDAVFGTGFRPPAEGLEAAAIASIAAAGEAGAFVLAVDLPSGLDADTGRIDGPAAAADLTVTFGALKPAHVFPPADALSGRVEVAGISFPRALLASPAHRVSLLDADDVRDAVLPRPRDAHKGTFGHLLLVAGSRGKTGAAVLAARAALRSGAGLVTVATPASSLPSVAAGAPELMTEPLAETASGAVSERALPRLAELLARRSALAIGPGLGTDPETVRLVRQLLASVELPLVVDADALNALGPLPAAAHGAPGPDAPFGRNGPQTVLLPHPGEAGRLLGRSPALVNGDRLAAARDLVERSGCTVALKGRRTLVASPGGAVRINTTGGPALATGGTGDVLTGIVGALLAQGLEAPGAAASAVWIHGRAGDLAGRRHGEGSVVASDVIDALPAVRRELAVTAEELAGRDVDRDPA